MEVILRLIGSLGDEGECRGQTIALKLLVLPLIWPWSPGLAITGGRGSQVAGPRVSCRFEWPHLRANWRDQAKASEIPSPAEMRFFQEFWEKMCKACYWYCEVQNAPLFVIAMESLLFQQMCCSREVGTFKSTAFVHFRDKACLLLSSCQSPFRLGLSPWAPVPENPTLGSFLRASWAPPPLLGCQTIGQLSRSPKLQWSPWRRA